MIHIIPIHERSLLMQKYYFSHLLALSLCLTGCSAAKPSLPVNSNESAAFLAETETESVAGNEVQSQTDKDLETFHTSSGITITDQADSSSFYAKDDPSVCVLTVSSCHPKVSIENKPEAAQKINDSISQELNTFWTFEKENVGYAEENRAVFLETNGSAPDPYTADFSYQLKRCDDKILSIMFTQTDYTGGAHDNYWSYGMTFDTTTGKRLFLGGLCNDNAAFFQLLQNELEAQASLPAYEIYIDKNIAASMEETFLIDSHCWYLDRSGLSFISNPYVLGPYAAGVFEFNIPYEKLHGFKEEYVYEGNYIQKIFPGISLQHDLNSNGTTDEICYSVAMDENFSNPRPTLIINGTDFSGEFENLYMRDPLTNAYYLMDVDPRDPYIEIAVTDQNPQKPDASCTHFFRYNMEKELIYQGKIAGIFDETMQVCYNSNGNLTLCAPDKTAETP